MMRIRERGSVILFLAKVKKFLCKNRDPKLKSKNVVRNCPLAVFLPNVQREIEYLFWI